MKKILFITLIVIICCLICFGFIMLNKKLNENVKEEIPTQENTDINELEITEQDLKDGDIKKSILLAMSEIKRVPKDYGIDKENLLDSYIGHPFYFCDYDFIHEDSYYGVLFFPIIDENKIIAILSVTNNTISSGCTAGVDFAPALMKCLESSEADNFALVTIEGSLYIVDEYSKWYQVFYRIGSNVIQYNSEEWKNYNNFEKMSGTINILNRERLFKEFEFE